MIKCSKYYVRQVCLDNNRVVWNWYCSDEYPNPLEVKFIKAKKGDFYSDELADDFVKRIKLINI